MSSMQDKNGDRFLPATEDRIRVIAAQIFQTDLDCIDLTMGPDDIDQWDSLNHLRLITQIENDFSLHMTMQQIQQINSLNDFATIISESAH